MYLGVNIQRSITLLSHEATQADIDAHDRIPPDPDIQGCRVSIREDLWAKVLEHVDGQIDED
jgi:hypothetical protein